MHTLGLGAPGYPSPGTEVVAVKKMMAALNSRRGVNVSPKEQGAIRVFQTMSWPIAISSGVSVHIHKCTRTYIYMCIHI